MKPDTNAADSASEANMLKRMLWLAIAGWVVSLLPVGLLVMSGVMKLLRVAAVQEGFTRFGYPAESIVPLGVFELVSTLLYVLPRTSVLGAILLTGYLGGAAATHLRVGDPWFAPVVFAAILWLGLLLREFRLQQLLPVRR